MLYNNMYNQKDDWQIMYKYITSINNFTIIGPTRITLIWILWYR